MEVSTITFDRFKPLADDTCEARIVEAKRALGSRAVILGHHYQRADVYKHADLTGDSLRLSKLASAGERPRKRLRACPSNETLYTAFPRICIFINPRMNHVMRPAITLPASASRTFDTSAPSSAAATR